ncbi:hypothetical protein AB0O22_02005 [Streptomyces sp. NPDC091204]|uniref:hypothetical protein n=1 Tax=Streptomyces sp. NPDC091204 TaxID=3155299 RepID=UPI0034287F44
MLHQAVAAFAEVGDRANEAMTLHNLALALQRVQRWEEANEADARADALLTGLRDG